MDKPVLAYFRMSQMNLYNGTLDPLDHLDNYKTLMTIQGAIDALFCLTFLATF